MKRTINILTWSVMTPAQSLKDFGLCAYGSLCGLEICLSS